MFFTNGDRSVWDGSRPVKPSGRRFISLFFSGRNARDSIDLNLDPATQARLHR
jgi:hypothetical protein